VDELSIDWMFPGGEGGARLGKRTVVVPGALPGETVRAVVSTGKGPGRAETMEMVTPSVHRQTPPCPYTERCGGCDLAYADPEQRLVWLATTHARSLGLETLDITASPRRDARARVRLTVDNGAIGYRAPRSHDLVAIDTCGIARPEIQVVIGKLAALPADAFHTVSHIELRSDGERCVADVDGRSLSQPLLDVLQHVSIKGRVICGDPTLWLDNGGPLLRASPGTFFQVNHEVNRAMVAWIVAQAQGAQSVADLYAGIGNFTLPLAQMGAHVRSVETVQSAVADCSASARKAGLAKRITAVATDADRYKPAESFVELIVLDPPRRGCSALIKRIGVARTPRVILVSCDPRSAVRDTKLLRDAGYKLQAARGFDLFPDTHHVELATAWTR
jgi:23S rRNA (uracil1939-C5)-methyltransferase